MVIICYTFAFEDIMKNPLNKKYRSILLIAILIIVMGVFRGVKKSNGYLFDIEFIVNFMLNTVLLLSWIISVYIRIIHKKIRNYLLCIGMLMIFWFFVRTIKYRVLSVFENMNILWYLFYIPIVLIPLLSYYIARTAREKEDYQLPFKDRLLIIPAVFIILGVLTNDTHKMAFVFEGSTYVGMTYEYGPFYYFSYLFSSYFALYSIYIMFKKSRIKESKKKIYLPFIIVILYICYSIFYTLNQNHDFLQFFELTVMYCITTVTFWESCIRIGLITSNSNYNNFFKYSTFNTNIVDKQGRTVYFTGKEKAIDPKIFEQLKEERMFSQDIKSRLYISEISGGYVIWQERFDYLLSLIDKLEIINGKLESEILLIQNQMDLDEKRIKLKEKNRLYNMINKDTYEQRCKIKANLEYISKYGNDQIKWQEINICATYIKRYSNLVFISEYSNGISLEDLRITIKESLNNLKRMGINESLKIDSFGLSTEELFGEMHGVITKKQAFKAYSIIQHIIERSFIFLKNIYIVIRDFDEYLDLSILLNGEELERHLITESWNGADADCICWYVEEEDADTIQTNVRFFKE